MGQAEARFEGWDSMIFCDNLYICRIAGGGWKLFGAEVFPASRALKTKLHH